MEDTISINPDKIKRSFNTAFDFLKQKKVISILVIVLFLIILISGSMVRLQNLPLLKDQTTDKYIPLALDPFYFLRLAETIIEQGGLPEVDVMRSPSAEIGFTPEILPKVIVFLYKTINIFDKDATVRFVDVISPVIFFALGLIAFFFLVYFLTKSKITALISSIFLSFVPPYLYRTLAGFADHEAIGMFVFFLVLLGYGISLKFIEKENRMLKPVLFGLLTGFLSALTIASWGGISNFVFMIIPLSFGLFWLIKVQNLENTNKKQLQNFILFYFVWIASSILFGLIYGFSFSNMLNKVVLNSSSLISGAVLLFILADFSLIRFKNKINFIRKERLEKYRVLYSLLIVVLIGLVFIIYQGDFFSYISSILDRFIHPFGSGRTGLTVAENKQPFLNDWISQIGKVFFWVFCFGILFVGFNIAKGIGKKKNKILFSLLWIIMIVGILFSRISSGSLFNGENFISRFVYFGSLILFLIYSAWVYFKDKVRISSELLLIFSWLFFILIAGRGAIRLLFVITPLAAFMGGYFIVNLFSYMKKSGDDLLKMILAIFFIVSLIGLLISFNGFVKITNLQAKSTGPSVGPQWQQAMSWVRDNTPQNSIFVHWWDYGYWIQYLGERPTVTDGGHGVGYWDHLIGRYLLTTPEPETALSFMKTHNVSYLLIDPTDLGKYGAYSKIGSDKGGEDRLSHIPIMVLDPNQIRETADKETRVYQGGVVVDEDIIYEQGNQKILLPVNKAIAAATFLEFSKKNGDIYFDKSYVVFIYNNQQISIPIRYVYFKGKLIDLGEGLNVLVRIIPTASLNGQQIRIDALGSVAYLSPKVMKSLFARLYLMDDPFNNYPSIKIIHSESDPLVDELNLQGAEIEDLLYYGGLRGPIKIWKVDHPSNILEREEFLRTSGEYAEFDDLKFTI